MKIDDVIDELEEAKKVMGNVEVIFLDSLAGTPLRRRLSDVTRDGDVVVLDFLDGVFNR